MYSYIFDDSLPWGQHEVQEGIGFSLLHLHDMTTPLLAAYWIVVALIVLMIAFAAITLTEMVA